ncbi:hypothetical protein QYM36_002539 [Artemia franciscana]|uniref:Puromycin-sensitive aminopeptidase n=1 Tax=Artemia franciscana TaxID=6661 RepID=A0AA88I543_ARTSF|nr:hypothetical protein QYM36_002539 [Artemia franciscana]
MKATFSRLPVALRPINYVLKLKPHIKTFQFTGSESIEVEVCKSTTSVVLNSVNLDLKEATIKVEDHDIIKACNIVPSEELETVTIHFPRDIPRGKGYLNIEYIGEIGEQMKGWYRAKYTISEGEERYACSTMFEPSDARRCFPCWDEPAHKATFDITLIVPKDRTAISNMPIASEKNIEGSPELREVVFERTPIMSTYLVAFFVGELDHIRDTTEMGRLIRVFTPKGLQEHGKFALNAAVKSLTFFEKYFDVPYPLPKVDLVPVPDFQSGAMENWGMVTFREDCMLVDPENSSTSRKQWIAIIVAHELAHQWFGNLVTMEWWTHLWLNEGYASFSEYLCVDSVFPEYEIWTQFVTDTTFGAFSLDSMKNSHPIEVPVNSPSEVDEIFDEISYNKGASVIRMLHSYIGDDVSWLNKYWSNLCLYRKPNLKSIIG